jgi:hypothetical protein
MKTFYFIPALLLFFTNPSFSQWSQVGETIWGEVSGDGAGKEVCLNSQGNVIAIGVRSNDGNGTASGHVRIFELIDGNWIQLGDDIDGENSHDFSGASVDLSEDGYTVAIGADGNDGGGEGSGHIRVFNYNGSDWIQIGEDIDGVSANDQCHTTSISADGKIVAAGSHYNDEFGTNSGQVRVFQLLDDEWVQMGSSIYGQNSADYAGTSVSLSSDGLTLAIGVIGVDIPGVGTGQVWVYNFNGTDWELKGEAISGDFYSPGLGWSTALSADGLTVIASSPTSSYGPSLAGRASIFRYVSGEWIQLGDNINGDEYTARLGESVDINSDGSIIVIGEPYRNFDGEQDYGRVRIFGFNDGEWVQISEDIYGHSLHNAAGYSVSLAVYEEKITVAMGLPGGTFEGATEIYELGISNIENIVNHAQPVLLPGNDNSYLLFSKGDELNGKIELFNTGGQKVLEKDIHGTESFSVPTMQSEGLYLLRYTSDNQSQSVYKLIF